MNVDSDKQIKLYLGDELQGLTDSKILKTELGNSFTIAECQQMSYEELLQRAFQNAYERNPNYFEEDRVTTFLYWHDDYLIDMGSFDWGYNETFEKTLFLSHFFYTKMTKYKDVLTEKVFERTLRICVVRTTRPVIKKIVNHVKNIKI